MDPRQAEMARSSSFARSLYQDGGANGNGEAAAEGQGPGMRRQRSRRGMSVRGSHNGEGGAGDPAMMAAAAAVEYEEGEPTQNLPHQGDTGTGGGPPPGRQSSWYTDALLQGGAEDLTALLGQVQDSEASAQQAQSDDDEVLEQYRIMAHVEANIRVKDNTGFDMAEYEKRRKTQPEITKGDYYSGNKKPKPKLPEPRLMSGGGGGGIIQPEEPPLPPPRANRRFIEQQSPKVPELCPGVIVRGQTHSPDGEHIVRCLGCRAQLRVNVLASLVNCPDCSTVSPASSSRR
jgi:hypothetical protein